MHVCIPGVKKRYDQVMRPISEFFHIKFKLQPNHVSCLGFLIGLGSVVLILANLWQLGLIIMAVSLLFDGIDGNIARVYGLESKTGEKLELIFDRSLEAFIFMAFALITGIDFGLAILVIYSILLMTSLRDKVKFDPGMKRVALFLGFIFSFELIFNVVFFIHIGSFVLQLAILDYVIPGKGG